MKIYLISPTHYNADGSLHKTTRYWTSGMTLPYLKQLTPSEHQVTMVDELFYDVDLESDADVVGLTAMGRRSLAPISSPTTTARAARRSCSAAPG